MILKTLQRSGNDLASTSRQLQVLGDAKYVKAGRFEEVLSSIGFERIHRTSLSTLQINLGKLCNQTCTHCHVDAGPDRRESMSRETAEQVVAFLKSSTVETLDITGGAPEMNPHFRWLVEQAHALKMKIIDRCNLTILLAPGFTYLPEFLANYQVTVIASLPCYLEENCDAQRGSGVFNKSIEAIQQLNRLGYGDPSSGLELHLVYNPVGTSLPPDQSKLEADFREQLMARYGLQFNHLYTITNMPISRYLADLLSRNEYMKYMQKLIDSFNPNTVGELMCRSLVSVDWNGFLFDCDFNQMLDLHLDPTKAVHISEVSEDDLIGRAIQTANHCFGCTAGCGSSCTGVTVHSSK
ncbi:MAG: arsenosugar biosynthesis radical SAM protein ArsS [Pirellulaceae bacterium]|nr:arsenosugar biosynthesis radical SAM protein ArsS [Pirellulaceae bacterium]